MVAELGQTTDPRELIPGDVGNITGDLREMVTNLQKMNSVKENLQGVNPQQWIGDAADQFRSVFGAEPAQWEQTARTATQGANALADFGNVLTWGQSEAQRAIDMFTQAQAASRTAAAQYNARSQDAAASGQSMPPFEDPGKGAAEDAQAVLEAARGKVKESGDEAAKKFGFKMNADGTYSKDIDGPEASKAKGKNAKKGDIPEEGMLGDKLGIGSTILSGEAGAGVSVLHGQASGQFNKDGVSGDGQAEGSLLGADASAQGQIGTMGASGSASADAYLAKGDASGELKAGPATLKGDAQGMVGAEASAQGQVGPTGASAGVDAFAGAKVSGDASAEAAGVTAGVHGEAWAGVGAEASGQFGMGNDGKFHIGASAGVGLGVGAKLGFNISIDPKEVENTVSNVAGDLGHVASDVGHGLANAADAAGNVADTAVHDIGSGAEHVMNFLGL